jgi:hypothetical protein
MAAGRVKGKLEKVFFSHLPAGSHGTVYMHVCHRATPVPVD